MEETLNAAALPQPKKKPGFWRTMLETLKSSLAPTAVMAVLWLALSWLRAAGIQWAILWPLNFLTGALAGMEGSAVGGVIGKAVLLICFNSLFRGLLYALLRFIDRADVSGGYSLGGTVWTVALVAAVFLLSALASLGYLRFAKISALLAGESRTEKAVRFPWLWPVLAAAALAAGVLACVGFVGRIASPEFSVRQKEVIPLHGQNHK